MSKPSDNRPAIYTPDNLALADVLANLPGRLSAYADHARLLIHFVATKRWANDTDPWGFSRLLATILRRYIPARVLGPLKAHLVASDVLETAGYFAGRCSTGYKISPAFDGPARRRILTNARLAEKFLAWQESRSADDAADDEVLREVIERRRPVLDHFRRCLGRVGLAGNVQAVAHAAAADGGKVERCWYAAQVIANADDLAVTVDGPGWRVHTVLTRIPREVRRRLLIDGRPTGEVDISCAQPLLLACLLLALTDSTTAGRRNSGEGAGTPSILCASPLLTYLARLCDVNMLRALARTIPAGEIRDYADACQGGLIYDALRAEAGCSREQAKKRLCSQVLFGKPIANGRIARAFGRRWPAVLAAVREWKRIKKDYKDVSRTLQRLESTIMYDCIAPAIMRELPGLPFLTIHDSAMLVAESASAVREIMLDEFSRWGVHPTINIKQPATAADTKRKEA